MNFKIFKIKKKFKKSEHQPNPDSSWRIVLFVTALLMMVSLGFGVQLYFKIDQENFFSGVEYNGQSKKISKERIDKALGYFAERAEKSKEILNSASPIIDPSI